MTTPRQTSTPPAATKAERADWRQRLQAIASTVVVIAAVSAGAVVAAAEALQKSPGDAIIIFCSALGIVHASGTGLR